MGFMLHNTRHVIMLCFVEGEVTCRSVLVSTVTGSMLRRTSIGCMRNMQLASFCSHGLAHQPYIVRSYICTQGFVPLAPLA